LPHLLGFSLSTFIQMMARPDEIVIGL